MSVRIQVSLTAGDQVGKKLLDSLQADLRVISNESKKKLPQIKEAAEAGIVKLRSASSRHQDLRLALLSESPELMKPFFMACDSKVPKLVQVSLGATQRLISFKAISACAAKTLVNCLWNLMENELEELKLLQTANLLISTDDTVQGEALAKGLALCFRLHFTKNQTVNNAASATIRQLISFIFERVQNEDKENEQETPNDLEVNIEEIKIGSRNPPNSLKPHASDAFMLFQDFLQLVNGDQPLWLIGLIEMTRAFGLELLEIVLTNFSDIFFRHVEFRFLLKERVSPLVIKLFSPNIKYKPHLSTLQAQHQQYSTQKTSTESQINNLTSSDKPIFPISARLLRIVTVLIQNYHSLLIIECEIFLSLLIKLLENDKPGWQKSLALEAFHKICHHPDLLRSFCQSYDMKENSSKILRDIIVALGVFCQSIFISPPITPSLLTSLINAASAASSSITPPSNATNVNQIGPNNGATLQPAFMLRGTRVPLAFTINHGQNKSFFMDQLDKLEAPSVPDGHGLTQAFYCLLRVVESISIILDGPKETIQSTGDNSTLDSPQPHPSELLIFREKMKKVNELDSETRALHEMLLSSTWTGLVAAFSLLLEASTDESISELILKAMENLTSYYGLYGLNKPRDAIIIAMCRSSLPIGYNLSLLTYEISVGSESSSPVSLTPSSSSATISTSTACHSRSSSYDFSNQWVKSNLKLLSTNASVLQHSHPSPPSLSSSTLYTRGSPLSESSDFRQQVVAVGSPLSSSQLSNSQLGPVMLTAKNLQVMKAVLTVAHSSGSSLNGSWHIVLTTLQHLAWILDLKPSTGGSLKVSKTGSESGTPSNAMNIATTMSDLPVLSAMLSRLFESSQDLDDNALLHLIDALCKLSTEAMEMAYNNREPSLFAVAKLLETSLVNLHRRKIIWTVVTSHLLLVCQHPQIKMREWGVEALTCLVKNVFTLNNLESGEKITFLSPLQEISGINHADIRQKQLDCVIQILQSAGESLGEGWPQILDVVGAINDQQSENLIRIAFQCVQLIIRDFLASIPALCLVLVVDTLAKFGSQTQEMNVALTAVSYLWDTADFLFQNRKSIEENLDDQSIPSGDDSQDPNSVLPAYDCLWMSLFVKLGDLCTDPRPSLRKSASQTLFATLTTHGEIVNTRLWSGVLWQVLFPLLDRVRQLSNSATNEKVVECSKFMGISDGSVNGSTESIMIHHSRNTAQKQWSETQVLILCGVSRIFCLKREQFMSSLDHFEKAWTLLLDHIEASAQSRNAEVSLIALKCFKDVLCATPSSSSLITASSLPQ